MKLQADLYITASLEGYITDVNGTTSWTLNQELRDQTARKYGCVCIEMAALKKYKKMADVHVIVLTRRVTKKHAKGISFVSSPQAAVVCAQKLGFKKLLVLGGAQVNQSFMQAGLVKKVFVDIHLILLRSGRQMFGDFNAKFDFTMVRHTWNEAGFTHAEYSVGTIHVASLAVIVRDNQGNYLIRQVKDKVCLGDTADLEAIDYPEHVAHRLIKRFTRTDYQLTECGVFDITPTHHLHLFEAIITRCPFTQRKAQWIDSQELNQYVVDKKITPQTAQAYSYYKQWL